MPPLHICGVIVCDSVGAPGTHSQRTVELIGMFLGIAQYGDMCTVVAAVVASVTFARVVHTW